MIKYSIVIPTYNHCDDLLKPCLESIVNYTDLDNVEIIVVANGCTDNTRQFIKDFPHPIKLVWMEVPAGYTKPTNEGIKAARGQYVVLLNNDIILLKQRKNEWLETMVKPFDDEKVAVTGPVKFSWDCGGITREAMAFWCVMIRKSVFNHIGILDEIFSPGMGEDGDFCIRAVENGYKIVSVPEDVTGEFEVGIKNFNFPIWHKGNGTFADKNIEKNEVIEINSKILDQRWGMKRHESNVGKWTWYEGVNDKVAYGDDTTYKIGAAFLKECKTIEDWGCGTCYFSKFTGDSEYKGIDGSHSKFTDEIQDLVTYKSPVKPDGLFMRHILEHNHDWKQILKNALVSFKNKFVLVLFTPLNTSETQVIATTPGIGVPDISFNIYELLDLLKEYKFNMEEIRTNTQYGVEHIFYIEHQTKFIETTIIVPTYNHLEDALRPCLTAMLSITNLFNKEIIVVSNGSTDGTKEYLDSLGNKIRYFFIKEPFGYIKAVNYGIYASNAKYVVTHDNDSILMDQQPDQWIHILQKPFLDQAGVGATSPFATEYEDMGIVLHSGCTMYSTDALKKVGAFDEIYNPGYFSDSDVSRKLFENEYKTLEVPQHKPDKDYTNGVFRINFPVMHLGNVKTMDKEKDVAILKKNRDILYARHGRNKMNPKFSIIIPTYNHCDDLLKPCIDSIVKYTEMSNVEIIVVANGCTDNTKEYLESISPLARVVWSDEALGYTKATNLGIQEAFGEFLILLNNDTELMPQHTNRWVDMLHAPFENPKVGLTAPLQLYDNYANAPVLIFFCVMIRKEVFDKIGLLDEIFSPGGGEDIDFTVRARAAGYDAVPIVTTKFDSENKTNVGDFPIWHKDNRTFREIPEYTNYIIKRNGLINCKRYNKDIKLNLGAGGVEWPGFLSVDLYDKRANILMDITKLDFEDNSVTEILASHVFEHLNPYHVWDILTEWLRVLKPGGRLVMEMPDVEQLCKRFVTATKAERYGILNAVYGSVNTTSEGTRDQITSPHLFGWWPEAVWDYMNGVGFINVIVGPEQIPHPEANFRVEGTKPMVAPSKSVPQSINGKVNRDALKSQDPLTYKEIFEDNAYLLLQEEIQDKTVVDLGANIGLFSSRCIELGASNILAVEAQPLVYSKGLVINMQDMPNVIMVNKAVYNSDGQTVLINNQNVASAVGKPGDAVETISLHTLLNMVEGENLILKIDIEGSEFEVLRSTSIDDLRRAEIIMLEIHTAPERTVEELHDIMAKAGFERVYQQTMMGGPINDPNTWGPLNVSLEKWRRK